MPPAEARALMSLASGPHTAAIGWISTVRGVLSYPLIAAVRSNPPGLAPSTETGAPLGYVVQRRLVGNTAATTKLLTELIGSGAKLYIGNARGDIWTDLVGVAPSPRTDAAGIKGLRGVLQYERIPGQQVLAAINEIPNTPWAIAVEFPRSLALQSGHEMLWRLAFITLALLIVAAIGAWLVSGTLTRPIARLVSAAEAMSAGEGVPPLPVDRRDELGTFAFAFNVMAERIAAARSTLEKKVDALRDAEARYRMLFDANPQPMWVYDTENYAFLAVNAAAIERYGYSRDAFLVMTILDIREADSTPSSGTNVVAGSVTGGVQSGIGRHRIKSGEIIDVEISSRELQFADRPARLVLVNDLTERRRADEALRSTRERLERVIGSSGAVLYELRFERGDTVLEWMSDNVTKLLGYSVAETYAPTWWSDAVHPADRPRLGTRADPESYQDGSSEYRFRHKDGRYRWIREEQRVVTDRRTKSKTVVGAWIDFTEQRQLETQLRQSQKMEAVGRLAGGVAHDFNNLLTVISAESQFLLADMASMTPEEQAESIDQIQKAAERAALLTRQLLTFSRQQLVEPMALDLNVVVADTDKMLRRLIGEDIDLRVALSSVPTITLADRGQIEQVIVNLAVNARDAMPTGGSLTIETRTIDLDEAYAEGRTDVTPGHYVVLIVADTGDGMSDDAKAHLFEPFFTTKDPGKGTGLGLATCYAIARQFGGHMTAYSERGLGTTMKLYLPCTEKHAHAAGTELANDGTGTETVLLVEDDENVRRLTARMLKARGYSVLQAGDGAQALEILDGFPDPVHLLLTDVVLPRMGGRQLAERVVARRPETRVLYMSGYSDDVVLQHRLTEHGVVLVQKPFTADTLVRKVHQALAARPTEAMRG